MRFVETDFSLWTVDGRTGIVNGVDRRPVNRQRRIVSSGHEKRKILLKDANIVDALLTVWYLLPGAGHSSQWPTIVLEGCVTTVVITIIVALQRRQLSRG